MFIKQHANNDYNNDNNDVIISGNRKALLPRAPEINYEKHQFVQTFKNLSQWKSAVIDRRCRSAAAILN